MFLFVPKTASPAGKAALLCYKKMLSRHSIDQLLQDRRPDPEEMLRNLGFTSGSKTESRRRVPVRFLQSPSRAKGICLEQLMKTNPELKECIEASKTLMTSQRNGEWHSVSFPVTGLWGVGGD